MRSCTRSGSATPDPVPGGGPRGRLAPSPTGALHLGNARTFLLAWLDLRSRGGRVVLRMEDLDGPRVKRGAARQVLEDLAWLGLDWDEGPDIGGPYGPYVQSDRAGHYAGALERLLAAGRLYPCVCTRREAAEAASAPQAPGGHEGPPYSGRCRGRFASLEQARAVRNPALRFRVPQGAVVDFLDRCAGPRAEPVAAAVGDFVVAKADGTPAYQLACVVDDLAMGITDVLRGEDLLPSTGRQLLLYRALGGAPPAFAHTPLLVGPDGRRLAKRHGDTTLRRFREAGCGPEALVGWLAAVSGLGPPGREAAPADLAGAFELGRVPRDPVVVRLPLPCAPSIVA